MIDNIRNSFDFFIRNKLRFSRKNYTEHNEEKGVLSDLEGKEGYLLKKYDFYDYKRNSTKVNYYQNLNILDFLDRYLSIPYSDSIKVLDVGSKNWFYVPAEYKYFKKYCKKLYMDGVELDAYRLYSNFYSRYEVAKYYTKNYKGANYIPDDVMNITQKYDYIIWILPFVTKYPLQRWGLPDKFFNPNSLFEHVYSLLEDSGKMVIINQGVEEFQIQKNIAGDRITFSEELECPFYEYDNRRFISIVEK